MPKTIGGGRIFLLPLGWLLLHLTVSSTLGQTLTHGPVVGGVTDSTANVFVRASQVATVAVRYGTDPNLTTYQVSDSFTTSSTSDFTKIIGLSGLTPEQTYYLNPVVNGVPKRTAPPYPSFRTFPMVGSARTFKFIVISDFVNLRTLTTTTTTFANASAESPDFAFIGGDFDHRNPATPDSKRQMFRELYDPTQFLMSNFVPLILEKMPIIHHWDDHDAGLNNINKTYARWGLSQQVFEEYVPTYPLPTVKPGIWQRFSYAQMEGFVLDCRSQRDVEGDFDDANKSMLDGNDLGAMGQLVWLKNGLLNSTAQWKVIFTSVTVNPTTKFPDGWAGYQTEWNDLKNFILSNNIQGVVFISGDLHLGAIDDGTRSGFPEMCIPQPNSLKPGPPCSSDGTGIWSEGYFENPCSGYGRVSVLQNPDRLVLESVDQSGTTRLSYTVAAPTPTPTPTPTATPTPTPAPPAITNQPKDATVALGQRAKFKVAASGEPPLLYQWAKNGTNIAGATQASYSTPPAVLADDGSLFTVTVSNVSGSVTSRAAKLTVTSASAPASIP
ncbi:MAG: alkaline phosphatase D family protein [Verrucomicrobiota bacterium]|nr:alkaline phosphatase D family protein [Verrucomicrobiota bacterium]